MNYQKFGVVLVDTNFVLHGYIAWSTCMSRVSCHRAVHSGLSFMFACDACEQPIRINFFLNFLGPSLVALASHCLILGGYVIVMLYNKFFVFLFVCRNFNRNPKKAT